MLKTLLFGCVNILEYVRFRYSYRTLPPDAMVYFIDIDNTLANTWPSLLAQHANEKKRYALLPIFAGMEQYCKQIMSHSNNHVYYISARPYSMRKVTLAWLKQHELLNRRTDLILVRYAKQKIQYIKFAASKHQSVIYIDDLSYGHEKGVVSRYEACIDAIKQLPVHYIGADEINQINSRKGK